MAAYFTDLHGHLFNFEDLPFCATLRCKVKPVDKPGMLAASPGIVNVDRFRQFIMFFELPVQANLTELLAGLREAAPGKNIPACSIERPEDALLDMTANNSTTFPFPSLQS